MAFAPPRPQSIFGRSAPPQAQIDWRLGAQVGPNIGGGIERAIGHLVKGFGELQEGKRKKAEEEEMGALLKKFAPGLGMTDTDIKAAGKNPNLVLAFQQLKIQQEKIAADAARADALAKRQEAAAAMAQQQEVRAKAEHQSKIYDNVLERSPDLTSMDASGNLTVSTAAYDQLTPDEKAAFARIPLETLVSGEKDQNAFSGMMTKVKSGIKGFKDLTDREVKAWASLDQNTQNRLISERPTRILIGGTQAATDYVAATKSSPIPAGRGFIFDAQGNYKGQFDTRTDSGRYKQFEQALRDAKNDQGYKLSEAEVNAYFLNEEGIDAEKLLTLLIMGGFSQADKQKLIKTFVETGGRGLQGGGGGGGGGGPPTPPNIP